MPLEYLNATNKGTLRCLKRDPGLLFGTFQAGCSALYWAGYVGVKIPNERHESLFKHQRVKNSICILIQNAELTTVKISLQLHVAK